MSYQLSNNTISSRMGEAYLDAYLREPNKETFASLLSGSMNGVIIRNDKTTNFANKGEFVDFFATKHFARLLESDMGPSSSDPRDLVVKMLVNSNQVHKVDGNEVLGNIKDAITLTITMENKVPKISRVEHNYSSTNPTTQKLIEKG